MKESANELKESGNARGSENVIGIVSASERENVKEKEKGKENVSERIGTERPPKRVSEKRKSLLIRVRQPGLHYRKDSLVN